MNIDDDDDHYIRLRDEYKYDYLMITTNKSKDDIFNELSKLFTEDLKAQERPNVEKLISKVVYIVNTHINRNFL